MTQAQFGVIGLAVMGENLALNIEEHGFPVAVWNRDGVVTDQFMTNHAGKKFTGTKTLEELVLAIEDHSEGLLCSVQLLKIGIFDRYSW